MSNVKLFLGSIMRAISFLKDQRHTPIESRVKTPVLRVLRADFVLIQRSSLPFHLEFDPVEYKWDWSTELAAEDPEGVDENIIGVSMTNVPEREVCLRRSCTI